MACLVSCLMGWSQTQHFYTADKLSSNQITGITQDGAGYIWIGLYLDWYRVWTE